MTGSNNNYFSKIFILLLILTKKMAELLIFRFMHDKVLYVQALNKLLPNYEKALFAESNNSVKFI